MAIRTEACWSHPRSGHGLLIVAKEKREWFVSIGKGERKGVARKGIGERGGRGGGRRKEGEERGGMKRESVRKKNFFGRNISCISHT